jgi:hypothetical protein
MRNNIYALHDLLTTPTKDRKIEKRRPSPPENPCGPLGADHHPAPFLALTDRLIELTERLVYIPQSGLQWGLFLATAASSSHQQQERNRQPNIQH